MATLPIAWALAPVLGEFAQEIGPTRQDPFLVAYILEWVAQAWERGLAGVWSPPFFFPSSGVLTLSEHLFLPSLLFGVIRALGASEAASYNVLLVSSFPLTALSVFFLFRSGLRLSRFGAALAALAVTYAPWRWGQLTHFQMLWAPGPALLLLAADRLLRRPSTRTGTGFSMAYLLTVASGCYLAYWAHLGLGLLGLMHLRRRSIRRRLRRRWRVVVVVALVAIGASAAIFGPYLHYAPSLKAERRPAEVRRFGAKPLDWLAGSNHSRYPTALGHGGGGPERDLFPGVLLSSGLLLLAATSCRRGPSPRRRSVLRGSILCSAPLYALLMHAEPYLTLARAVPGMAGMRVPTRLDFFVLLALGAALGIGMDRMSKRLRSRASRGAAAVACAALLSLDLYGRQTPEAMSHEVPPAEVSTALAGAIRRAGVEAIVVLPFGESAEELRRMWVFHRYDVPIANGHSGYLPPSYRFLRRACRPRGQRISGRCLSAIEGLGVSHILVERRLLRNQVEGGKGWLEALLAGPAESRVAIEFRDENVVLMRIKRQQQERRDP